MQNIYLRVNSFILVVVLVTICAVPVSARTLENVPQSALSSLPVSERLYFSLSAGDHIELCKVSEGAIGYDFTVIAVDADGTENLALLFYSDPKGIESLPQQFDNADPSNPDGTSRNGGCNIWVLSDLYHALNDTDGTADLHDAAVPAALLFSQRLQAEPEVWEALKPCISTENDTYKGSIIEVEGIQYQDMPLSNGEKVSLLSEYEYEWYKSFKAEGFSWNDGTDGWWLKTPRAAYSHSVRYLYSDDFTPSLDPDKSFRRAAGTLGVRPALRLDVSEIYFQKGNGSAENPYGELRLKEALEQVELRGELEAGQTLSAIVLPENADCVFRWYRGDLPVASVTGGAYVLTGADVGETISVEVEGSNLYRGTVTAGGVEQIRKGRQNAPTGDEIPALADIRITSSEVDVLVTHSALEYGISTKSSLEMESEKTGLWTGAPVFTDLLPDTEYFLYVRKKETEAYFASPPAVPVALKTKEESDHTVSVRFAVKSYDPKKSVTAKLVPSTVSGPGITLQAISTTSTGIGIAAETLNMDGAVPGQTYDLILEKQGHVRVRVMDITVSDQAIDLTQEENPDLRSIYMPCGDADGDGTVGLIDRSLMLSSRYYGKKANDPGTTGVLLDFDGDGYVKLRDLQIMMCVQNYGKSTIILQYEGRGG